MALVTSAARYLFRGQKHPNHLSMRRPALVFSSFSLQTRNAGGHGHDSHEPEFYEQTSNLFGEKPPPPGQKRVKEDWENVWVYGWLTAGFVACVTKYYSPYISMDEWAEREAKKRMAERGEKFD
ncbi:hypothetical protein G9A89_010839 [Geosiphon pyriformis]|nr:hypothetical protein G9A89_010839 [Geosiphon pyriformis]